MNYQSLNKLAKQIAIDLQSLCNDTAEGLFKTIRIASLSNNAQVQTIINDIGLFPTAIVNMSEGAYTEQMSREISPSIIIIDTLRATTADQSNSLLEIMDKVLEKYEQNYNSLYSKNQSIFYAEGFQPLLLEDDQVGFVINLKVVQPLEN